MADDGQPGLREQLVGFISTLENIDDAAQRRELISAAGCPQILPYVALAGSTHDFAGALLDAFAAGAPADLANFMGGLETARPWGVDDRSRLEALRTAVSGLSGEQWRQEFPVSESQASLRAAVEAQTQAIAALRGQLEAMYGALDARGLAGVGTQAPGPAEQDKLRSLAGQSERALAQAGPAADPQGYYVLGWTYAAQNDFDRAEDNFLAAVQADPQMGGAYLALSALYQMRANAMIAGHYGRQAQQDLQVAEDYLNKARALDAGDSGIDAQLGFIYKDLALSYSEKGQADQMTLFAQKAEAQFRKVLAVNPDDPSAHNGLGDLYQIAGRYDLAVAESREATRLAPTYLAAWYDLASAYYGLAEAASTPKEARSARQGFRQAYTQIRRLDGTDAGSLGPAFREALDDMAKWLEKHD